MKIYFKRILKYLFHIIENDHLLEKKNSILKVRLSWKLDLLLNADFIIKMFPKLQKQSEMISYFQRKIFREKINFYGKKKRFIK